jgi:hypothetical protein
MSLLSIDFLSYFLDGKREWHTNKQTKAKGHPIIYIFFYSIHHCERMRKKKAMKSLTDMS